MEKIITESEPENLHRKGQLNEVTLKSLSIIMQMKKPTLLHFRQGLDSAYRYCTELSFQQPFTLQPHFTIKNKTSLNILSLQWKRSVELALGKLYHSGRRLGREVKKLKKEKKKDVRNTNPTKVTQNTFPSQWEVERWSQ